MADRRVTRTDKDEDGDILALCGSWGRRERAGAIADIEGRIHTYYVASGGGRSDVHVVDGPTRKYLRTDPNGTAQDNLDSLPDC